MSKNNRVFLKKVRVIFIYCLKTYKYWRSQKNTIYQHICMTKYILTVWSSFTLNAFRAMFFDFWLNVKAAPHECVIKTGQP